LALFYDDDKLTSVPRDPDKYQYLLELGSKRGDGSAAAALGNMFLYRNDPVQAHEYYERSVRLSLNKTGAAELAQQYRTGWPGVEQNFERATYWAIFGVKLGSERARSTLYDLISSNQAAFKRGYGPDSSFDSIVLIKTQASRGDIALQIEVARSLEKRGNTTEAITWYTQAAEKGSSDAQDALTRLGVGKK